MQLGKKVNSENEKSGRPVRWLGFSARREMSVRPENISVAATVAGEVVSGVARCIAAAVDPGLECCWGAECCT